MAKLTAIQQNERLRRRYEKAFRPVVKDALLQQYGGYVKMLRAHGAQYVLSHPVSALIDPAITTAVQQIYKIVGVARATLTYNGLKRLPKLQRKRGPIGFNAQWTNDIIAYFRLHLFDKVVLPISETTREYIYDILTKGITEGLTLDEMVSKIERQDYIDGRTERILRTEINRAINYGNQLAGRTYEFKTQKKWVAVHDNRTRHPHLSADGQTVDIDGTFLVGGEVMDFPGDPNASAANTINCRCHTEIIPVRSAAGRLMPKEPQPVRVGRRLRSEIQQIIADLNN